MKSASNKAAQSEDPTGAAFRLSHFRRDLFPDMSLGRESDIHVLPPEVWCVITALLESHTVRTLWTAGDKRLRDCLQNGGLVSLTMSTVGSWSDVESWPSGMFEAFPKLRSVTVSRTKGHNNRHSRAGPNLTKEQVSRTPRTVNKLDLSEYYVSHNNCYEGPRVGELLKELPSSHLTWLSLPAMLVNDDNVDLLPPSLTYLELGMSSLRENGLKALPGDLQHLILKNEWHLPGPDWCFLPRDLLTFSITSRHLSSFNSDNLHPFHLLPPKLTHLTIDSTLTLPVSSLASLPQSLETIHFPITTIVEDHQGVSFNVPVGLTSLSLYHIQENNLLEDAIKHLPPQLKTFALRNASNLDQSKLPQLPRSLTNLTLKKARRISSHSIQHIPTSITRLTITGIMSSYSLITHLPPRIKYLDTGNLDLGLSEFDMLPPTLIEWKTKRVSHMNHRHPFNHINIYEKPTLLRTAASRLFSMDGGQLIATATVPIIGIMVARRMNVILPAIPNLLSNLLLRYRANLLSLGLLVYYSLR